MGDSLPQLADLRKPQAVVEFRLSEQHNLQQLVVPGFEVGQQPDLFQCCQWHALRLFDKQNDIFALGVPLEKVVINTMHGLDAVRLVWQRQPHLERDGVQNLVRRNAWVGEVDGLDVIGQASLQHAAKHRLAAAHLAGYLDDAFALRDCVNQCLEDCTSIATVEEHLRVRGDLERRLGQPEKAVVHLVILPGELERDFAFGCRGWCDACPAFLLPCLDFRESVRVPPRRNCARAP